MLQRTPTGYVITGLPSQDPIANGSRKDPG